MKLTLPSLQMLADAAAQAIRRFPLPFSAALICTAAAWTMIDENADRPSYEKLFMVSFLAVPALLAVQIFGEARRLSATTRWLLLALTVAILIGYWWWLDPQKVTFRSVEIPRYFAWLAVAHLVVTFAPFLHRREGSEHFWEFNKQLFGNWLSGAFFGAVIYIGLAGALMAADHLFELHINYRNYYRLFFTIAGIFHPLYFLYHFPRDFAAESCQIQFPKTLLQLCKYILIPIVGLYFLILYAFTGKILLTWALPQGWVSSLVLGFAGVGILTWLLNYMLPLSDSGSIVRNYRKWFWWVLLPMIFLLFVAIARRIMDYGITESRFFVAHLGAWLLVCTVFFIFIKSKDIKFVPLSLAVFLILATVGPFSALESSKRSQKKELIKLLKNNQLWENDRAKPASPQQKVEENLAARIVSIADFFIERDDRAVLQSIFNLPHDSLVSAHKVLESLHLKADNLYLLTDFFASSTNEMPAIEIAGYQKALQMIAFAEDQYVGDHVFRLTGDGQQLVLAEKNTPRLYFSLETIAQLLRTKRSLSDEYRSRLNNDESIFDLENETHQLKIWVQNVSYSWEGDRVVFKNIQGFGFLRSKN